jgi:diacylglycerol kinase family enzyme
VSVIVNAGAGHGAEQRRELEEKFRAGGVPARVTVIRDGSQIPQAAAAAVACGSRAVIAAGGDGTVSAVASRLAGTGVPMGVLPMGTLNHFAKDLGIPLELDGAVQAIARGREVAIDAAQVNGRVFINNSSLGLYPDIVLDRERQRRRLGRGKWQALLAACVHAARRYPVLSLRIGLNGEEYDRRSSFVFVGNNLYRMEGFNIGERERMDAGQLSLYVTQRTGRFGLLVLAVRALFGGLRQASDFDMVTARELVVHTPHQRIRVATDGEVTLMETPLHYRILPGALRVIVPPPAQLAQGATA